MSIQAPDASDPNYSNMVTVVQKSYQALGADRLASIAIGNEVEGYDGNKGDPSKYIGQVHEAQQKINAALGLTGDATRVYEVFDFSSGTMDQLRKNETADAWTL